MKSFTEFFRDCSPTRLSIALALASFIFASSAFAYSDRDFFGTWDSSRGGNWLVTHPGTFFSTDDHRDHSWSQNGDDFLLDGYIHGVISNDSAHHIVIHFPDGTSTSQSLAPSAVVQLLHSDPLLFLVLVFLIVIFVLLILLLLLLLAIVLMLFYFLLQNNRRPLKPDSSI